MKEQVKEVAEPKSKEITLQRTTSDQSVPDIEKLYSSQPSSDKAHAATKAVDPEPSFIGFTVGGNANRKCVISEAAQRRIANIFADSSDESDCGAINAKLDELDRADFKPAAEPTKFIKFKPSLPLKEFQCPVKVGTSEGNKKRKLCDFKE